MQDRVEIQGVSPAGQTGLAGSRAVSADSFRRLTALLKKTNKAEIAVPDLKPVSPPPLVQPEVAPPPPVAPVPEAEPQLVATQPEIAVLAEVPLPEPELQVGLAIAEEPPAPPPVKAKPAAVRKKPVDAFSLVLNNEAPEPKPEPVFEQSPEQESEQAELARALLDMMAQSVGGGLPQERALAADTLLRKLPRLPTRAKIAVAERLSMMEAPPTFLVAKLISDSDIAVAGPLLEECPHISDENLLNVIADGNPDKLRMIARRRRVSPPVGEALAKTGDDSVLLTLARNQGVEATPDAFRAMAAAAPEFPDLLAPLCTRQDLPVHFAFELFWLAPAQLRRYLLHRFLTDSETLTRILKITMHGGDEDIQAGSLPDHETIWAALSGSLHGEEDEAVQFLAAAARINETTVRRILADMDGEPLMALLKVIGLPRSNLEEILPKLIEGEHPLIDPTRVLDELQAVFGQLSNNKARILLTYWDWATLKTGPYAAEH